VPRPQKCRGQCEFETEKTRSTIGTAGLCRCTRRDCESRLAPLPPSLPLLPSRIGRRSARMRPKRLKRVSCRWRPPRTPSTPLTHRTRADNTSIFPQYLAVGPSQAASTPQAFSVNARVRSGLVPRVTRDVVTTRGVARGRTSVVAVPVNYAPQTMGCEPRLRRKSLTAATWGSPGRS